MVGLGNPGKKYKNNRHNVGWLVFDALKQEISKSEFLISKQIPNPNFKFQKKLLSEVLKIGNIQLAKPQTMMNSSGSAVKKLVAHYKINMSDLWVIHDDLDIKLGDYKIQKGKGPREHNGLISIYKALGAKDFWHVRVGVDNRELDNRMDGERYVLQNFTSEEFEILKKTINKVIEELLERLSN